MTKEGKSCITTSVIIIALVQGPILYYFTFGFFKLIGAIFFGLIGLILTLILFLDILRHKSTNTKYHIIGLIAAFFIGLSTSFWDTPVEYLDFYLRKSERDRIVEDVKKSSLKPNDLHKTGTYHLSTFLPISNNGNDIDVDENKDGIVSIIFYIDRGFLDHYSAFVYTNDPDQISKFNNGIGPFDGGIVKKLDTNWYRVSY